MFNYIKNKAIIAVFLTTIVSGCASEPITVLDTRHGVLIKEHKTIKSESNPLAVIGGAAAGGLLGNQVGGGSGKTVATVVGTLAGGTAGNALSKSNVTYYEYTVSMNDGEMFLLETGKNRKKIGSKVVVEYLSTGRERINVVP